MQLLKPILTTLVCSHLISCSLSTDKDIDKAGREQKLTADKGADFLWAATVRSKSFEDKFKAAKAGEFTKMSAFPIDIKAWEASGSTIADLKLLAARYGVKITVLDPLTKWLPRWEVPGYMSGEDAAFVDFDEDEFFRMAAELDVESISIIETFGTEYEMEELVHNASRIADRGDSLGMQVHIEFMPFSGIPDLGTTWEIVQRANRKNLGIVFDTWHYYRGKVNDSLLATIPGEKIYRVQLADATLDLKGKDIFDDLMHYRLLPGQGEFPLEENFRLLEQIGGLNSVGIELFSDKIDLLNTEEIGLESRKSINRITNSK